MGNTQFKFWSFLFSFRVLEITASHRQEIESESERSRAWQAQMEKTAQARERAYKQKTKGLEEQVRILLRVSLKLLGPASAAVIYIQVLLE